MLHRMATLRIIAFAAASGRVGFVLLVGERLMDWQISNKAGKTADGAAAYALALIDKFTPDVVVTEQVDRALHKGSRAKDIIEAIAQTAADNFVLDVSVVREQRYPNKYVEADALVARYPDLAAWKPIKRRFFDNEPRNTVLFEALALADEVVRDPNRES
jgi:hypothetical protein